MTSIEPNTPLSQEELVALRDLVRRLVRDHSTQAHVRRTMESESGFDLVLWHALGDAGLLGLLVSNRYGGLGGGPVALEALMEEVGSALLCGPLLASSVMAAALLEHSKDEAARARLLPGIADGTGIVTVALTGDRGTWTRDAVDVTAAAQDGAWHLDGVASYVLHAGNAKRLLVVARVDGDCGVFEVDPAATGVRIDKLATSDRTLRLGRLVLQSVPAARLQDTGWNEVDAMLDVARVALAGEQAGAGRTVFEMTVEYVKTRVQFGRPVGGFQAIKHMAADLLLECESSLSAARNAAERLAEGGAGAAVAVNLAAFACADAFLAIAAQSIQMHGGIAFTWEHPAHLYLRRARADAQLFGDSNFHRERYLAALGA